MQISACRDHGRDHGLCRGHDHDCAASPNSAFGLLSKDAGNRDASQCGLRSPTGCNSPLMFIPTVTVMIARIACVVVVRTAGGRKRQHQSRAYQQ